MHATAVTTSQSMPAGQLSVRTMAGCYNCCAHSLSGPSIVPFVLIFTSEWTKMHLAARIAGGRWKFEYSTLRNAAHATDSGSNLTKPAHLYWQFTTEPWSGSSNSAALRGRKSRESSIHVYLAWYSRLGGAVTNVLALRGV